jgi:hypothetical protein
MSAPDFYFSVNAIFHHIHDRYGKPALVEYWRRLAVEYYRSRIQRWRDGGLDEVARDWGSYFQQEPGAQVIIRRDAAAGVELNIEVCPAIKHLRDHDRQIVPCFCEHCDHTCGAMAEAAGLTFERTGGMGSCRQRFFQAGWDGEPT